MRRPSRFWRTAKWVGLGSCTVIAIVWVMSGWWRAAYFHEPRLTSPTSRILAIEDGGLAYYEGCYPVVVLPNGKRYVYESGVNIIRAQLNWAWLPYNHSWHVMFATSVQSRTVFVPCWIPFLCVTLPTSILYWRDHRRIQPGHCKKCGYDLTGNVSGRCPECGRGV